MCDSIVSCCSGSYKPITLGLAAVSLVFSVLLTFQHTTTVITTEKLDPSASESWLFWISLKLLALALSWYTFTVLYMLYYKKLAYNLLLLYISLVSLIVALILLTTYPGHLYQNEQQIIKRLDVASKLYNYHIVPPLTPVNTSNATAPPSTTGVPPVNVTPTNGTNPDNSANNNSTQLDSATATFIWDFMQSQGCCGLNNYTDWNSKIPKSCCNTANNSSVFDPNKEFTCQQADSEHQQSCIKILDTYPQGMQHMLQLIVLLLFFKLVVSGINLLTPSKYLPASQSAI